jgi:predicted unusual protein kinase regulating ubiquinone biosynthesis (AarF/ABC1/UbiB family)
MNKNINNILFCFKVFYILASEFFLYFIFKDYSILIDNLTKRLSSINILYVKIFQAFALNNHFIDDVTNNKLLQFTDNAPWTFNDYNLTQLNEISNKYNIVLKFGYEIPINSGMISLVFKGYKNDDINNPVIIKMKRKNIEIKLNEAINNLIFFMYLLSFIPLINKYQLSEVVNKNIEIIRRQTDFLEEVDNMNLIKNNCKNLKYIIIPTANRSITEQYPDIIVMEYINGIKINQIQKEDYEQFAKLVVKFGLVTTILHGVTHGDLHSGNILFIKDKNDLKYTYKIGVIDFGIIYNIEPKYKAEIFDVLTQIFQVSPRQSAEKILNSSIIEPAGILQQISQNHYDNIVQFLEDIICETIQNSKKGNQIQIYKFLSKLKTYLDSEELSNNGIKPSEDFVKTQLVLAMAHGVTLTLCNHDFMGLMDQVLNELFHTNMLIIKN